MKIKRLEIQGFKSFADKVVLDFQQGVTGVVGPNGCGKSNIVDAIRWCMGEQSAKNLRGKAMEDVIFAGSDNRKPLGLAEVSLVFSTEDGRAPAKYLEFGEIQLTRRLYRDGESEYLINKIPCRLMDISELFMDTGVGTRAYSIIEQGKIGQILHSRPEERRLLIEEAAGVTKYKVRKQLALRKIEATRQNLVRLADVMGEIKRQLNALQRQAKKAEKFRECRDELRDIDVQFTLRHSDRLAGEQRAAAEQLEQLQQRQQQAVCTADAADGQVELRRIAMLDAERELNLQQEALFAVRGEATACEHGLGFRKREQESVQERQNRLMGEQQQLEQRRVELEAEQEQIRMAGQSAGVELQSLEMRLTELQQAQQDQEQEFDTQSRAVEAMRREQFSAGGEAAQFRARREAAHKRLVAIGERLERCQREQSELVRLIQENRQQQEVQAVELAQHSLVQQQRDQELEQLASEEQQLKIRLPELETVVGGCREDLSRCRSRLHSLQELEAQYAGYGQGVRLLMTESPLRDHFRGLLADALFVPKELEQAVEAVLADRLQAIVCGDRQVLEQALAYLAGQATGRAQFVLPKQDEIQAPPTISGAQPLLKLIELEPSVSEQLQRILSPVYLVADVATALQLGNQHRQLTFVTNSGVVVAPDGTVSGGSSDAAHGGIIHKKREIRELEEQTKELQVRLESQEGLLLQAKESLQVLEQRLQACRAERHRLEVLLTGLRKDQQQLKAEADRMHLRSGQLEAELVAIEEEQQALQDEQQAAALAQEAVEARAAVLEQSLKAGLVELDGKRQVLAAAREVLTAQRIAAATLKEQVDGYHRSVLAVTERLQELAERRQAGDGDGARQSEQLHRLASEIVSEEQRLHELLASQLRHEEQLQVVRRQYEEISGLLASAEQAARQCREDRELIRQAYADLSLQVSSLVLQQEHLVQQLYDRHRLGLDEARERLGEQSFDEAASRVRQVELERIVDELGEVNLMAIDEYAGMEQRYEFLAGQKADLEESLQDLQQAINRINRTTRKRFLEAYTQINEKFQEVFPRLFCGGKAELRLTDEQDLLETGIEIIVQPPGKKLSNVMLLSGGEKALTAVALIFSIFLIKPTPFCLLDEVDAPLDDANIGRFNDMVREMSSISQFIIITHNKATMAVADTLYGVTMEEPGASRLVSVKLH